MFENTRNHNIMIFVKRMFAPDMYLRLRSLLRFFCETEPRHRDPSNIWIRMIQIAIQIECLHETKCFDPDLDRNPNNFAPCKHNMTVNRM